MRTRGIPTYGLLAALALAWLVGQHGTRPLAADQAGGLPDLAKRVAALEATVASLQQANAAQAAQIAALKNRLDQDEVELAALDAGLTDVEAKTAPIRVVGTEFQIIGTNVSILDGSGATESKTGLGNLIVGYNENGSNGDDQTGTHNLVVGRGHHYSSFGGLVAGEANSITGRFNSISGGTGNSTAAFWSTVSGGTSNAALGDYSTVSGGGFNSARNSGAVVSGGEQNTSSGTYSTVSGGLRRSTSPLDFGSWAAGGLSQAN
jgi:hypothetical protein